MAKKYLDDTGMSYFWGKLKAYFQEKLVSGTNIKTINSESVLGSGNIQVTASVTSTSTPTANTISKFDSSAHMNSADMTSQEVSDFVDSLDTQGAQKFKYATLSKESVSVGANNTRAYETFSIPSDGTQILCATMVSSPNPDWVICRPYIASDTTVVVRMKNEYTSALSGALSVAILYI